MSRYYTHSKQVVQKLTKGRIAVLIITPRDGEWIHPTLIHPTLTPSNKWATRVSFKWHLDRFRRFFVHRCKDTEFFSTGRTTPKFPLPLVEPGPHLVRGSLGPTEAAHKRKLDRSAVFAGLTNMINRQTNTQTTTLLRL